jgi:hypothetical protein
MKESASASPTSSSTWDKVSSADDAVLLLREIRDELASLRQQVADLTRAVAEMGRRDPRAPSTSISEMTEDDLRKAIAASVTAGDPYGVLDHRRPLADRLSSAERTELDRELAGWFSQFFQQSLRSGQALVIAGAMERAVAELTPLPELEPLAEALPLVRRTIGVWEENLRREEEEWD